MYILLENVKAFFRSIASCEELWLCGVVWIPKNLNGLDIDCVVNYALVICFCNGMFIEVGIF